MAKVAIFVDVQNIYYTVKQQYNCHFDYTNFFEQVVRGRELVTALAYATDRGDNKQTGFQNILRGIGFSVKLIPFIQRQDGSAKGDWDVGIALDMMEWAKQVDVIVLASGDGDFAKVVESVIQKYQVEVDVYGVPDLTAASLKNAASRYLPVKGKLLLPIPKSW